MGCEISHIPPARASPLHAAMWRGRPGGDNNIFRPADAIHPWRYVDGMSPVSNG